MMKLKEISFEELENFALTTDEATFHQTKGWAKLKEHNGWHHYVVGLYDEDEAEEGDEKAERHVVFSKPAHYDRGKGSANYRHDKVRGRGLCIVAAHIDEGH